MLSKPVVAYQNLRHDIPDETTSTLREETSHERFDLFNPCPSSKEEVSALEGGAETSRIESFHRQKGRNVCLNKR